jgi:inner membrane protein
MASLGHFAVGMAAARVSSDGHRPSWRSMAAWSAVSMLPDADVVAVAFGVAYEDAWGHRGATHSLAFAALIGGAAALTAPRFGLRRLKTWVLASLVAASHPLLDTMTDGGLGCALFWPFDLTRYFAPWRPIPVSPLGLAFLSPSGAVVAAVETILFSPLLVYALRPASTARRRHVRVLSLVAWMAAVWLIGSPDPLRQRLISTVLREQTEYAPGFSERAFASVARGMSEAEVAQLLGPPLEQWWQYADTPRECRIVVFDGDRVVRWRNYDFCTPQGIGVEMSADTVRQIIGAPPNTVWSYSRSAGGRPYQTRAVWFEGGKVFDVMRRWAPGAL